MQACPNCSTPVTGRYCPNCGQHILVAEEWHGRGISCPACQHRISIPNLFADGADSKPAVTRPTIRIELPSQPRQDTTGPNGRLAGHNTRSTSPPTRVTGNEPWAELVKRLEMGASAEPAALATALFRELTKVRQRLDEVERRLADSHPNPDGTAGKVANDPRN